MMMLLEESFQKLQLISLITRELSAIPLDISEQLNEDQLSAIKQHKILEEQYAEFLATKKTEQLEVLIISNTIYKCL
jgi:hypothetical protein